MKELIHVLCNLTEYESLGDQLCRIDNLCEKIGLGWSVDINYSVAKNAIVADVYSEFPEMDNLYKDKSLDETERILTEKAKEAECEYRKKIFTEAAEIAAIYKADSYTIKECNQWLLYDMDIKIGKLSQHYSYSSVLKSWVTSCSDGWMNALTGEIYSVLDIFDTDFQKKVKEARS